MFKLTQLSNKKNQDNFNTPFRELFKIHIFTDEFFLHEDSFYFRYLTDALNIEVPGFASSAMSFFKPGYDGLVEFYQKDTLNLFEKATPGSWRSFYRLKPEYLHDARKSLVHTFTAFYKKLLVAIDDLIEVYLSEVDDSPYELYHAKALIKMYLNDPKEKITPLEREASIQSRDPNNLRSLNYLTQDATFTKNLSKEYLELIQDICAENALEMEELNACANLEDLNIPFTSTLGSYFKEGITKENIKDPAVAIYESFFKGDFEKLKTETLAYRKFFKKELKPLKFLNKFQVLLQLSRMKTNSDISTLKREIGAVEKKQYLQNTSYQIACSAVLYLNDKQNGQENKFYNKYYDVDDIWLGNDTDYIKNSLKVTNSWIYRLPILCAVIEENPKIKFSSKLVRGNFNFIKDHFPALAKRLYNTLASIEELNFCPELKNDEFFDLTKLVDKSNIWRSQLDTIIDVLKINKTKKATTKKTAEKDVEQKHLAWVFNLRGNDSLSIGAEVITCDKDGSDVSYESDYNIKDFFNSRSSKHTYLTDQDRAIASNYERIQGYRRNSFEYVFSSERTLPSLVGHPYLYLNNEEGEYSKLKIEEHKPKIEVTQEGDNINVKMPTGKFGTKTVNFDIDETNGKLIFRRYEKIHTELKNVLGSHGATFPKSALDDILSLGRSSDVEVDFNIDSNKVKAVFKPTVLLSSGKEFTAKIRIKPVDDASCPYKIPAIGESSVIFNQKGSNMPVIAARDFTKEEQATQDLIKAVTKLNDFYDEGEYVYSTDSVEDMLALLEQINTHKDLCQMEWNEGKKMYVTGSISPSSFSLNGDITAQDYLSISGNVTLSEDKYISLKSLLRSLDDSKGNYIKIDDEHFVAITSELKKKLEKLNALTVAGKKDELLVHPLAGKMVEDLVDDLDCKFTDKVTSLITKRDEALNMEFKVPKTLKAQLRSYQEEGYEWLCRLAHWGVGACLADDMGLGKTVQTIAAMLKIAVKGPSIIIAPTSVCPNWERELNKFAPNLKVSRLKEADDRAKTVESLGAGEVLIVSYGLFSIESEILSKVKWHMAVFDEAQALKNSLTQRAKTATMINAKMRLALTGTPIENNLDDLWSIFNIINPGLLGTKQSFHIRFADAHKNKVANRMLKLLISPFILRRLKGDVLDDLPPRTEQVITVEPTQREQELYEALRLSTLEELEKNKLAPNKAGQRRLQILSSLTKLRQFCCDPALLGKELKAGDSSKTKAFEDLLDEALSGGHRLLVFSQFVTYLQKIKAVLDKKKISYQYLDGSTTEKNRAKAINEFQAGEGDVFLISLKAGGQGLNLTGADYVVHLDPWWNPAVEDQATDRAYRIGQTRPVNVIRLVVKDSLEEKILELHAKKREIAADFLEGTSSVAAEAMKLSEQELLDLLN